METRRLSRIGEHRAMPPAVRAARGIAWIAAPQKRGAAGADRCCGVSVFCSPPNCSARRAARNVTH